jgi:hypothetical protein
MNQDERRGFILLSITAVAVLCLCASLLIAALNLGAQLVTSWLLIVFNVLLLIVVSVGAIVLAGLLLLLLAHLALQLADKHPAVARAAKAHRPAIGAVFLLAASVLPSAGSPFFGDNVFLAAGISIVMTVLFFIASGYMSDKRPWGRRIGFVLWYASAILLPVTVGFYHNWNVAQMARTAGINTPGRVFLFVAVSFAILVLPRWTPAPD